VRALFPENKVRSARAEQLCVIVYKVALRYRYQSNEANVAMHKLTFYHATAVYTVQYRVQTYRTKISTSRPMQYARNLMYTSSAYAITLRQWPQQKSNGQSNYREDL